MILQSTQLEHLDDGGQSLVVISVVGSKKLQSYTDTQTHRKTDIQTDRETDTQTDTQTERQDRHKCRHKPH